VDRQAREPGSPLNAFRRFMRWRRQHPALVCGDIRFLDAPAPVLAFVRTFRGHSILALFNLSGEETVVPLPVNEARELSGHGLTAGHIDGARARLPAYGSLFSELSSSPAMQGAQSTPTALVRA